MLWSYWGPVAAHLTNIIMVCMIHSLYSLLTVCMLQELLPKQTFMHLPCLQCQVKDIRCIFCHRKVMFWPLYSFCFQQTLTSEQHFRCNILRNSEHCECLEPGTDSEDCLCSLILRPPLQLLLLVMRSLSGGCPVKLVMSLVSTIHQGVILVLWSAYGPQEGNGYLTSYLTARFMYLTAKFMYLAAKYIHCVLNLELRMKWLHANQCLTAKVQLQAKMWCVTIACYTSILFSS